MNLSSGAALFPKTYPNPALKNDAFAGSEPMKVAYIVFRNSGQCNFLTGYCWMHLNLPFLKYVLDIRPFNIPSNNLLCETNSD